MGLGHVRGWLIRLNVLRLFRRRFVVSDFDSGDFEDDGEVLCGVENPESCESCQ